MSRTALLQDLLESADPAVRYRVRVRVLGQDPESQTIRAIQDEVRDSPRVQTLLATRGQDGRLHSGANVYAKWQGAHWILAALADLGYPPGEASLAPIGQQVLDFWLRDGFYQEFEARSQAEAYKNAGVPVMHGRHRRCASQQGNALYCLTRLGIAEHQTDRLVERLLHWQWPDGGWNCDKDPKADTSSFMETLLPMRGLWLYGQQRRDETARAAALRAAEVFLSRQLFKRRSTGELIHREFGQLHYPLYWHYDFLAGLKAMAELGLIDDPRCADALDLLEHKELPGGGWPAERRYYKVSQHVELSADYVDWGGTSKSRVNPWVSTDALFVLRTAGRLRIS